jgi:hypothetical protein
VAERLEEEDKGGGAKGKRGEEGRGEELNSRGKEENQLELIFEFQKDL